MTLYIDCFSGASGDMLLGALLHAGANEEVLREQLATLGLSNDFMLSAETVVKGGVRGMSVTVSAPDGIAFDSGHDHEREHNHGHEHGDEHGHDRPHEHRGLSDILRIIENSGLSSRAKNIASATFQKLGEAEAEVHGVTPDDVHFHEVGAVDAIVDICGAAVCIAELSPKRVIVSPVNVGSGMVRCAHGLIPVPAPATALLVKDMPVYSDGKGEMLTPTGAALLATLADEYGPLPMITIQKVGYGHGKRDTGRLNAVRAMLCEGVHRHHHHHSPKKA